MARLLPNYWDALALVIVLGLLFVFGTFGSGIFHSLADIKTQAISLSPWRLMEYGARTSLRMILALGLSLLFTLGYAALAAKNRSLEKILIPLLDILQSVPILGFVSITYLFFLSLAPGSVLGLEMAAIFAIFTSQAWNMTFSLYQSLRSVPAELKEAARNLQLSGWAQFWRIEIPFALPALTWNLVVSFSGGWFFIVAAESIHLGQTSFLLPGIGAYIAVAIEQENLGAIYWAILAMSLSILVFDQLLFRPLIIWSERFRLDGATPVDFAQSWVLTMLRQSHLQSLLTLPVRALDWLGRRRAMPGLPIFDISRSARPLTDSTLWGRFTMSAFIGLGFFFFYLLFKDFSFQGFWNESYNLLLASLATSLRVIFLVLLTSLFWIPIGIAIGLNPRFSRRVQFLTQLLSAFPANLIFPLAVGGVLSLGLNPEIWLSPLMIFGAQWYILFNIIAGANNIPMELRHISRNLQLRGWLWLRKAILPAIFPYYLTGAITASGGAWNASIVAEYVAWGNKTIAIHGLGSYIAQAAFQGDQQRVLFGVTIMCLIVISFNRLLWRPLYNYAEKKFQLA